MQRLLACSSSSNHLLQLWRYRDLTFLPMLFSALSRLSMNLYGPTPPYAPLDSNHGEAAISQRPFRKRNTYNNMCERTAKGGWTRRWCKSNLFAEGLLENSRIWISTLGSTVEKPITCPGANILIHRAIIRGQIPAHPLPTHIA